MHICIKLLVDECIVRASYGDMPAFSWASRLGLYNHTEDLVRRREQPPKLNAVPILIETFVFRPRVSKRVEPYAAPVMTDKEYRFPAAWACRWPAKILVCVLPPTATEKRVRAFAAAAPVKVDRRRRPADIPNHDSSATDVASSFFHRYASRCSVNRRGRIPVVAWSPDHTTEPDRRSPFRSVTLTPAPKGDLRSGQVAWSGDHATTETMPQQRLTPRRSSI